MWLPTGDYLIQFFDAQGGLLDTGEVTAATLADAQARAAGYLPLLKAARWRILRVVEQSGERARWGDGHGEG